jgi:hypothetical protein
LNNQWDEKQKIALCRTIPKSNGKIDTRIHDRSLTSWLGTYTVISITNSGFKLVLWAQSSPLSEMMGSCKCFPYVGKISTLLYIRFWLSCLGPMVLLFPKLLNYLASHSCAFKLLDEGYFRNGSCALNLISTFLFLYMANSVAIKHCNIEHYV